MDEFIQYVKVNPRWAVTYSKFHGIKRSRCNAGYFKSISELTAGSKLIHDTKSLIKSDDSIQSKSPASLIKKHKGTMSKKAKSKIENCMYWMLLISPNKKVFSKKENMTFRFKINFITLTLSSKQIHNDCYIKSHMLAPFLKFLHRSWNINSYIWKAEAQKNGNIHFHITTNKFVHWRSIRMKWNSLQFKHGYVTKQMFNKPVSEINSTDVHAVKNESQIIKYMLKYFSKSEKDKRPIHGKLWDASENLNQTHIVLNETNGSFCTVMNILETPALTEKKVSAHHSLYIYKRKIFKYLPLSLRNEFNAKIQKLEQEDIPQYQISVDSIM